MAFPDVDLGVQILAYMGADPTAAPGTWPAPVDLSSRLLDVPMRRTRGRSANQRTLSSGSCTFTLRNDDGYLTPLLPTSPYYGQWDLGTPVLVNVTNVGASPPYGLFPGYVSAINQTVTPDAGGGTFSSVEVTIGGKVRQLSRGSTEKSALARTLTAANAPQQPVVSWPLETSQVQILTRGDGGPAGTARLALTDGPGGSDGAAQFSITTTVGASFSSFALSGLPSAPSYTNTGTTIITAHVRQSFADGPANANYADSAIRFSVTGATGAANQRIVGVEFGWTSALPTSLFIDVVYARAYMADGSTTAVLASTGAGTDIVDGQWHEIQLRITQSGADLNNELWLDGTKRDTRTVVTTTMGTITGVDRLSCWYQDGSGALGGTGGFDACWLSVHTNGSVGQFYQAMTGYAAEQAHVRFGRVCAEEGIPNSTTATASVALGSQPFGDVMKVLRDLEVADHGVLSELVSTWGLGYRAGRQRYSIAAALTVDLSTYRVSDESSSDVLTPIRNDQRLRNRWTIDNPAGDTATVTDATSVTKRGVYDDSATVNTIGVQGVTNEARWRVHEDTYDGLRFAGMPLDLAANPSMLTTWLTMALGDRIDRTNPPAVQSSDAATLELEGYTESISRRGWKVDAVVEPYEPWRVGIWGNGTIASDDTSRWDGSASTTSGSFNTGSLPASLTVATSSGALWTTTGGHFPLKIMVSGVVLTVSAISGATSPQTFTVTAASASKTIPSGSAVHIFHPSVYALL